MISANSISTQCVSCPGLTTGRPQPCIGQFVRDGAYCKMAESGDEIAMARILEWIPPDPEVIYSNARVRPTGSNTSHIKPESRPKVAEAIDLLLRMKSCRNFVTTTTCGCGINLCKAQKGLEGKVNHQDCFNCLRETDIPIAADHQTPEAYD